MTICGCIRNASKLVLLVRRREDFFSAYKALSVLQSDVHSAYEDIPTAVKVLNGVLKRQKEE